MSANPDRPRATVRILRALKALFFAVAPLTALASDPPSCGGRNP